MIQLGVCIGYGITAPFIEANARPEAIFYVIYPVVTRASSVLLRSIRQSASNIRRGCEHEV